MKLKITSCYSLALIGCALGILSAPASLQAKPFTEFVEFSGALSDTGNYASTHGDSPAPFYKNRTTNGLVAGELLAARLGLTAEPSYHLIGPVKGTNFSVRDALAGGNGPDDLPAQLTAYFNSHGGKADPDAFYFVFNGGNDVILAVLQPTDEASKKILSDAVKGLETALRTLVKKGAKTILAPNFIDLSYVPALRNTPLAAKAHKVSVSFNEKYDKMLTHLEHELKFKFIHWDFNQIFLATINHGDEFGFTNTTQPCADLVLKGQANADDYLFLTDTYPTARVHEIMAEAMATTVLERDSQCENDDNDHSHDHD